MAALAMLVPAVAHGAATYTTEDNDATLVVDVDADGATLNAAEVTAGITKIVKRGAGKLTSVNISTFSGDFDIEQGIWCCTGAGQFGVTNSTYAGTIDVRDGASIEYGATGANPGFLAGKTVNLYGAAATGAKGKLFLSKSAWMGGQNTSIGLGLNMMLVLHDNATLSSANRFSLFGTFDLGGHQLTLAGSSWEHFDLGGVVTNGGSIVVKNGITLATATRALDFAADCAATAFVQLNGGSFDYSLGAANGWSITNNGGTIAANRNRASTSTAYGWDGPVVLSGAAKVANYGSDKASQYTKTTTVNLMGELSGTTGTLLVGPGWLNLHGPAANTYSGAVTVRGKSTKQDDAYPLPPGSGGIGAWSGAGVFTNASSITCRDSARLEFMDDTASTVGAVSFIGDTATYTGDPGDDAQSITGGSSSARPTIAGIVKTGTNALVIDSPVHVTGRTVISNGTLRIGLRSRRSGNGLEEKLIKQTSGNMYTSYSIGGNQWNPTTSGNVDNFDPTNSESVRRLAVEDLGENAAGPEKAIDRTAWGALPSGYSRYGYWYHGYLWNRTDEPVTWRVCDAMTWGFYIFVRGDNPQKVCSYTPSSGAFASVREIMLQPGANEIDIVVWSHNGKAVFRTTNSKEISMPLSYCTDTSWDITGVTAPDVWTNDTLKAKFTPMSDGGSGTLFTTTQASGGTVYTDDEPVFEDLEFLPSTTLDLNGNFAFYAKNLTGCPTVTNGTALATPIFGVTNHWTILSSDFPKSDASVRNPMVVEGMLTFSEGTTFSVDDDAAIAVDPSGTVVATASGGIQGIPVYAGAAPLWRLAVRGNSLVINPAYTLLIFR